MKRLSIIPVYIVYICFTFISSQPILELTNETFLSHFTKYDYGFIFFYSTDSPFCHSIFPVLNSTSYELPHLNISSSSISISQLNLDKYPSISKHHNIHHTPSIIWFNNKQHLLHEYLGDIEMSSHFINYIQRNLNFNNNGLIYISSYTELTSTILSKHKSNFDKHNSIPFICNAYLSHLQFQIIVNSAFNIGINNIFYTNQTNIGPLCRRDNGIEVYMFYINDKGIVNYEYIDINERDFMSENNNEDMIKIEPYYEYTVQGMENIMLLYSKEKVNLFTKENEELITQRINTFTLVHDFKVNSTSYNNLLSNILPIIKLYRKDMLFMIGTSRTKFSKLFIESFNIKNTSLPSICVTYSNKTSISKYKQRIPSTNITEIIITITSFLKDLYDGKLIPYIASQDDINGNEIDDNGILYLNGNTYESIFNKNKDILIIYCSFKIGICKEYMSRFKRIANRLKHNVNLTIAYIDPYENEIYDVYYNYIPAIVLYKANRYEQKEMNVEYEGKLITRSIIDFIAKNVVYEIDIGEDKEGGLNIKEEIEKEIKRMELDKPGVMRRIYQMLIDEKQAELYMNHNRTIEHEVEEYINYQLLMEYKNELNKYNMSEYNNSDL